jgi:hypothetical protein
VFLWLFNYVLKKKTGYVVSNDRMIIDDEMEMNLPGGSVRPWVG